ncbi:MAG: DUF3592 domain-containing protein, partial [Clostridia bacterium]|nr:DUF3592 domain-containing protein [Clostridia bacterium]
MICIVFTFATGNALRQRIPATYDEKNQKEDNQMAINTKSFRKVGYTYRILSSLGFILVGLIFLAVSVLLTVNRNSDWKTTEATIESIEYYGEDDYVVMVRYTVNGKTYVERLNEYSSSYAEGETVEVRSNPQNPAEMQSNDNVFTYVALGAGLLAIGVGVFGIVEVKKQKNEEAISDVSMSRDAFSGEPRPLSPEAGVYYTCPSGKAKQGFRMDSETGEEIAEAVCKKFTLFRPATYEFVYRYSGRREEHKIGHTVTTSTGNLTTDSHFSFDGVNVFTYLKEKGYTVEAPVSGIRRFKDLAGLTYTVSRYGQPVAEISYSGNRAAMEKYPNSPLAALPVQGYFRVRTEEENLDIAFLSVLIIVAGS